MAGIYDHCEAKRDAGRRCHLSHGSLAAWPEALDSLETCVELDM